MENLGRWWFVGWQLRGDVPEVDGQAGFTKMSGGGSICGMMHVRTSPYYPQSNGKL